VLTSFPKLVRRPRRTDPVADPDYLPVPVAAGAALGGCFIRAIFLALFLLFALFLGGLFVGGSLLQGFGGVVVF
jgi:hypothetical protein